MNGLSRSRRPLITALAMALLAIAAASPRIGAADEPAGGDPIFKVELAAGQDRSQERFVLENREPNAYELRAALRVRVGSLPAEIEIAVSDGHSPDDVKLALAKDPRNVVLVQEGGRHIELRPGEPYRELLGGPSSSFAIHIVHTDREKLIPKGYVWPKHIKNELVVTLRRVTYCSMWARVNGDVNGTTFGDIAYFNTFGGAAVASGNMLDPGLVEMMGDMIEAWGDMAAAAEARAGDDDGSGEGSGDGAGDGTTSPGQRAKEEWLRETGRAQVGGDETFGLTLIDQTDDGSDLAGLGTLLSGFVVEAAASGDELLTDGYTGPVKLKRLEVTPGLRDSSSGDRIPFVWAEGEEGSAQLLIISNSGDLIYGNFVGELHTVGHYGDPPRRLKISVGGKFVAARGALACQSGGLFQ